MSSKKKRTSALMTIMAAMAASSDFSTNKYHGDNFADDVNQRMLSDSECQKISKEKERQRKIKLGLTEFKYGENIIWARNRKNADRKAKNKGIL